MRQEFKIYLTWHRVSSDNSFFNIFAISAIDFDIMEKKGAPLLSVRGIPECTWLSFEEKNEGKP